MNFMELKNLLQQEFLKRIQENSSYSMRAFSLSLGCDVSVLSRFLNDKNRLGQRSILKISHALKLSESQIISLQNESLGITAPKNSDGYDVVEEDKFFLLANWYNNAILELLKIKDFEFSLRNVSSALGLPYNEVAIAIDQMVSHGLMSKGLGGCYCDLTSGLSSSVGRGPSFQAKRDLQKQYRDLSVKALESIPIAQRSHSSLTVAVHRDRLPEIKKKIAAFRRELDTYLESDPDKNEVYQFNFDVFPLTDLAAEIGQNKNEQ